MAKKPRRQDLTNRNNLTNTPNDSNKEIALSRLNKIYDNLQNKSNELDKYIFTSSTGSLLLSITFIEKIFKDILNGYLWIIFFSWISLTISIVLIILSYFNTMNTDYKSIQDPSINKDLNVYYSFSFFSFLFLIIGIILFGLYSAINMHSQVRIAPTVNEIKSVKYHYDYANISEVIADNAKILSKPESNSPVLFELKKQSIVKVIFQYNYWSLVEFKNELDASIIIGWIDNRQLRLSYKK